MNTSESFSYGKYKRPGYDEREVYSAFDSYNEKPINDSTGNMFQYKYVFNNSVIELHKVYIGDCPDILIDSSGERFFYREPIYDNSNLDDEDIILQRVYIDPEALVLTDCEGKRFFYRRNFDENGRPMLDNEGDEVLSRIYIDLV